jgi:hypothetical protein
MAEVSFERHRFPAAVIRQAVWLYFLSTHAAVYNTFNTQPHLISRPGLRSLRAQAHGAWAAATAAA